MLKEHDKEEETVYINERIQILYVFLLPTHPTQVKTVFERQRTLGEYQCRGFFT